MFLVPVPWFGVSKLTLSFVDQENRASPNVNFPAGIANKDLSIVTQYSRNTTDTDPPALPTGYISLYTAGSSDYFVRVSYKVLTGSETTISISSTGSSFVTLNWIFRPNKTISSVTASGFNSQITFSNPSSKSVSLSGVSKATVVVAFSSCGGTSYNFSTASPSLDNSWYRGDSPVGSRTGYKLYNTGHQTHSVDMADEGAPNLIGIGAVLVD